jgi:serine O-acetyltransferase
MIQSVGMAERGETLHALQRLSSHMETRACLPVVALVRASTQADLIRSDVKRWPGLGGSVGGAADAPFEDVLAWLVAHVPQFRSLLYYRLAADPSAAVHVLTKPLRAIWKPMPNLYIYTPTIGPGCVIQHGFSTIIAAKSIGGNFLVNQQVTIAEGAIIGDNVSVRAGAIVSGSVTIGDGATVGAGAVVWHDVPPGATVIGTAARQVGEART